MFVARIANTGKVPLKMNANDELMDVKGGCTTQLSLDDSEGCEVCIPDLGSVDKKPARRDHVS